MKAIAANPCVEVAVGERETRSDFWDRPVKSVVETGKLCSRRKYQLCGGDQRESLRNVQRRKVDCSAQFIQNLWRYHLMLVERWAAVHHAVANGGGRVVGMLLYCRSQRR